jgi:tripartite motif-containing protein 71
MYNAYAQTNGDSIGTKRIIEIQKTTSSGENVTNVSNELITSSRSIDNIGGIVIDKFSNIYLADSSNHTIQKFDPAGKFITKWGSTGSGDAQFNGTLDIATDSIGNVYIFDGDNQSIQKFDSAGKFLGKFRF